MNKDRTMALKVGDKVRLKDHVNRFPHFMASEGATGVITVIDWTQAAVLMDEPLAGCEEWNNQIWWTDNDIEEYPKYFLENVELVQ